MLPFDGLVSLIEFLEVVDFHFDISLVNRYNFLIKFLNLFLEIFNLFIHPLDVEFSLSEVLPAFVLLFFQMLFQEAKVTRALIIDFLSTALPTNGVGTVSAILLLSYQ